MVLLIGMFVCGWITEIIGVHAIFGSFILGVVVPRRNHFAAALSERIEDLVVVIFLPLYFTFSGLRTDIGALTNGEDWGFVVLVVATACTGKILGGTISAKFMKYNWKDSFTVGVLMNTKGLVELIVLNVGLDVGVLNTKIFTMFVIMALVTTFMTTPIVYFLYIKDRAAQDVEQKTDAFTILLCIQNAKTAPSMVTISGLFAKVKESVMVKVMQVQEISDRPSSYFFSEFSSTFHDAPIIRDRKRKNLMNDVRNCAKAVGVAVETKSFASANLAPDVAQYAANNHYQICLFEMHHHSASEELSSADVKSPAKFDMRQSFANVTKSVDHQLVKVVGESDVVFQHSLKNLKCNVGAVVYKTDAPMPEVLTKIMFISTKPSRDKPVLDFFKSLPATVQITIVANDAFDADSSLTASLTNLQIERSDTPMHDFHEHSKKGYELIVMTATRGSSEAFKSAPVHNTKIPVLVLFPAKRDFVIRDTSSLEVTLQDDEDGVQLP
eukprot:TRINITY_DN6698_c0_g2_i1.p1 TRINITY_DN6698_c0_g2~~TRINITY_DN6698_c0_g2_i1.p1  ORF type:complete len:497 (-),score=112.18 TRINITY_DN6698_c0_g2_i1:1097-2587(-)